MGKRCEICKKRFEKGYARSFYPFPLDIKQRRLWFSILSVNPREDILMKKYVYICSDHFDDKYFYVRSYGQQGTRRHLKKNAIPKPKFIDKQKQSSNDAGISEIQPVENIVPSLSQGPLILKTETISSSSSTITASEVGNNSSTSYTITAPKIETANEEPAIFKSSRSSNNSIISGIDLLTRPNCSGQHAISITKTERSSNSSTSVAGIDNEGVQTFTPPKKRRKLQLDIYSIKEPELSAIPTAKVEPIKRRVKTNRYPGDIDSDDFSTPRKAKRNWNIARRKIEEQKKKIKNLQKSNRRLEDRVKCLNFVMSYLKQNNFITEATQTTLQERLQQQLDEQAQRYEEQLTELHSVIAELTRKLHQQRTMAIAEEDEVSESCTSAHEESVTCPLEVSELEPLDNELLSDLENKMPSSESPLELPEPKLTSSHHETNELSPFSEVVEPLKNEITNLKHQLQEAHTKLAQISLYKIEEIADEETITDSKNMESPESHIEIDCDTKSYHEEKLDIKYSNIVPIHKTNVRNNASATFASAPVTKVAERIKLKRATDGQRDINPNDLLNSDLSTAVAEHIVGDILRQCDLQAEKHSMDIEMRKINAKLEHARSQNTVLAITLSETKAHCDRLALLCGKYESNAIALRLALGINDRAIEAYDVLLALLETELSLKDNNPETVQNRTAAETVAKQLLHHLDSYQSTDVLLSPWQNHVYSSPTTENNEPWTSEHEMRLREHVSRLKAERSNIQGTYVALESTQVENVPVRPSSSQEVRKMDLEMAVLMQELMGLREDKAELISKLFALEKEKSAIEVKLKYVEGQQKAQSAALKNLQGQLKDTEALLALATQNKERGYSDAEHAQGVELELMQALAREARLKVRLQELVTTLEQVTKNAEARLLEGREIVQDLNHTNSILAETVDRNNKKYQAKFKKMEQQMFIMVEKHTAQVQNLQQKIATLETPPTNSSENSVNSVAV